MQPKRSTSGAANRWTHFGARLRPLTSSNGGGPGQLDHHHEAASSSKATAALADPSLGHPQQQQQYSRQQGHQTAVGGGRGAANPVVQLQGNNVDGRGGETASTNQEDEEDEDDLDSEALLYKLMQQQSFLMNPNFQQEQQASTASLPVEQSQQRANGQLPTQRDANQQQQQNDDNMAKSKRVIKLLKSYSHIHQVDDSDDQIRGSYARYPSRPQQQLGQQQHQHSNGAASQQYLR